MKSADNPLDRLVLLNPDFREICEDYEEVFQALDHWRLTPSPDAVRMIKDYGRLLRELEIEALEYVYRNATQSKRTRL